MMIIYWVGGEIFLLDPTKADLSLWQGIVISGGSLTLGWLAGCGGGGPVATYPVEGEVRLDGNPVGDRIAGASVLFEHQSVDRIAQHRCGEPIFRWLLMRASEVG